MRSPRTPLRSSDDVVKRFHHSSDPENSIGRLTRSAARKLDPEATSPTSTGSSSTPIIREKSHKKNPVSGKKRVSVGRWEKFERVAFLKGLREHGRGHWKLISTGIPTRNTIQVKTHAQVVLKKHDEGFDIYQELDDHLREEKATALETVEKENTTPLQNSETKKRRGRPRKVVCSTDDFPAPKMSTIASIDTLEVSKPVPSLLSYAGAASFPTTTSSLNMTTIPTSFNDPRISGHIFSTTTPLLQSQHQTIRDLRRGAHVATSMAPRAGTVTSFSPHFLRFFPSSFEESRHRVAVLSNDLHSQQPQSADAYAAAGALLGLARSRSHL